MYSLAENDDFDRQEIATYEEVARLLPHPAAPRPIVLIGPPGVGRNELKRRLIALDPDKFRTTIPCNHSVSMSGSIHVLPNAPMKLERTLNVPKI